MNKIFDLRFVIGSFFTLVGLILLVYGFVSLGTSGNVDEWCGGIFIIFGVFMILISFRKDASDELLPGQDGKS
jgi:putative Mn2+ efflux pump MntP